MLNNEVVTLYTKHITAYHVLFMGIFRYHKGMQRFFKKNHYLAPNIFILDVGCGSGTLSKALFDCALNQKIKIKLHAFDCTPAMLAKFKDWIKRKDAQTISTTRADVLKIETLPSQWHDYDLIVTSGMLEYIHKDTITRALENIKSLLKTDGTLLIAISRNNAFTRKLITSWWKAQVYDKQEIIVYLEKAGFTSIIFKKFPFPYTYLNAGGFIIEAKIKL